tara:strand:+ start:4295 stop:4696 length:402 start_codon:yes stop_codon:yes gene_type:complete
MFVIGVNMKKRWLSCKVAISIWIISNVIANTSRAGLLNNNSASNISSMSDGVSTTVNYLVAGIKVVAGGLFFATLIYCANNFIQALADARKTGEIRGALVSGLITFGLCAFGAVICLIAYTSADDLTSIGKGL